MLDSPVLWAALLLVALLVTAAGSYAAGYKKGRAEEKTSRAEWKTGPKDPFEPEGGWSEKPLQETKEVREAKERKMEEWEKGVKEDVLKARDEVKGRRHKEGEDF